MIKSFFWDKKWLPWAYGGGIVLLISLYAQVQMSVMINSWYGEFYDLLQTAQKHTIAEFQAGLMKFMWIAIPYCILATITNYFTRIYSFRWREAITFNYIPRWRNVKEEIEGASQRIQEDTFRFARIVESLGIQTAESAMTLVAFLPILWGLSSKVNVSAIPVIGKNPIILIQIVLLLGLIPLISKACGLIAKTFISLKEKHTDLLIVFSYIELVNWFKDKFGAVYYFFVFTKNARPILQLIKYAIPLAVLLLITWELSKTIFAISLIQNTLTNQFIPGFLVWVALIVSVGGMIASWFIGNKLPGLEYNNQKVEAAYRKELVLGEEDKINHSSVKILTKLFLGLKVNYYRLYLHYGYFDIWRTLFNQFMVIVPYIIMGPGLFSGLITLGILVKVSNSFEQVRNSFSLFINNWTTVTELRSIHMRLCEFEKNLDKFQPQISVLVKDKSKNKN